MIEKEKTMKMTGVEKIESHLIADCMLERMLSNLSNLEEVSASLQAINHLMVSHKGVQSMVSIFMKKIKKDSSFLSDCPTFGKRILLFTVMQCIAVGENLEYTFGEDEISPLENALMRLSDIVIAFDQVMQDETFCEVFAVIWEQTLKQAIFVYLRHNQTVKASQIMVVYTGKMLKKHQNALEKLIKYSEDNKDFLEILDLEEHSYSSYCFFVAEFIQDLNLRLQHSTLSVLAQKVNMAQQRETSQTQSSSDSDVEDDESGKQLDTESEENMNAVGHEIQREDSIADEHRSTGSNGSELGSRSSSPVTPSRKRQKLLRIESSDSEESQDFQTNLIRRSRNTDGSRITPPRTEEPSTSKENPDLDSNSINPKNSLAYRLRQQIESSGIVIPCQHIVSHCRQIHKEEESENEQEEEVAPKEKKIPSSTKVLPTYKSSVPPRNLILGDRFEGVTTAPLADRSYVSPGKKRLRFTVKLDSYIVAGCQSYGVGKWADIMKAFPFPDKFTNMKIKDRFRTLVKCGYVAVLDDGDISVLNKDLKAELPDAHQLKKDPAEHRTQRGSGYGSHSVSSSSKQRDTPRREPAVIPRPTVKPHLRNENADAMTVTSMPSSQSDEPTKDAGHKFTLFEDGYIVCGVRYLGFMWSRIKEKFNFHPDVSPSNIKARWGFLVKKKRVIVGEDGELSCRDEELKKKSKEASSELRRKIQLERKSNVVRSRPNDRRHISNSASDSGSSDVNRPPSRELGRRRRDVGGSMEEIDPIEHTSDRDDRANEDHDQLNKSFVSDAGTQTKRRKLLLGKSTPTMMGADSDSVSDSSGKSKPTPTFGSPIRPSRLNHFKQGGTLESHRTQKVSKPTPAILEMRSRRQREIMRKQRRKFPITKKSWSSKETKALLAGLHKHGPGKWVEILDDNWDVFRDRNPVMIKDKYRNMMRTNEIPEDVLSPWKAKEASKE